jgi:DNA segregation ATPase FtsK/SpoIIIE, S-DNA-T family
MYFCLSDALHGLSAQVTSSQDQNTDFDPLAPRLSRYAVGMGPEIAAAAVQALADLLTEMERRGKLLATLPGSPRPPRGASRTNPHSGYTH